MRFLGRTTSSITAWIVAIALNLSPLMAQNATAPGDSAAPQHDDANSPGTELPRDSTAPMPDATSDSNVDTSVLPESITTRNAIPTAASNRPLPAVDPSPARPSSETAPGESKWIILAVVVATGVGVALYYLLRGIGGGKSDHKAGPLGTIITAGSPSVNTPNH